MLPRSWTPVRLRWWSVLSSPGGADQLYSDRGTPDGSGLPGIRLSGLRDAALELHSGYGSRDGPATAIWTDVAARVGVNSSTGRVSDLALTAARGRACRVRAVG